MAEKMGGQSVPKKNPDEESEDINMEDSVEDEQEITAEEAEEYNALNNQIDELNTALDTIEKRNDDIHGQLLELLRFNRQFREEIKKPAEGSENCGKNTGAEKSEK